MKTKDKYSLYDEIKVAEGVLIVVFLFLIVLFMGLVGHMDYEDKFKCYESELKWSDAQKEACK
jgi:hypothetical protein